MIVAIILLIVRVSLICLTTILLLAQVKNYYNKINNSKLSQLEEEIKARKALITLFATAFSDNILWLVSDIGAVFFHVNRYGWIETMQIPLLVLRLIQLFGLVYFFLYIFNIDKQKQ